MVVPEGLDDVGGDGGAPFVLVGLPRQRHAVPGYVGHHWLLWWPRQLDGLRGPGDSRGPSLYGMNTQGHTEVIS